MESHIFIQLNTFHSALCLVLASVVLPQYEGEDGGVEPEEDCQMAKFGPFLFLDRARVESVVAQSKERKVSNFAE